MALLNLENFTALLICKKTLGISILILMFVWLHNYRGGFAWQSFPSLEFNWHPILTLIGMVILNGNAILVYRGFRTTRKSTTKWIHAVLHIIGFLATVTGLKAVLDSHNHTTPPIANFYSLHSWIGIVAVVMFAFQWIVGLFLFLYPGANAIARANYHPVHIYCGIICFGLATCAAVLGFLEKAILALQDYHSLPAEGVLINIIGVVLLVYSTIVLYMVMEPSYKRPASEEAQNLLEPKPSKRISDSERKMK